MPVLTAEALSSLLLRLDDDQKQAADKYEVLRHKLCKTFEWKSCPESAADRLADDVLDRVAAKLAGGEKIQNLNAYALEVARFVWLEFARRHRETTTADGEMPEQSTEPRLAVFDEPDLRLRCLRKCLAEIVPGEKDRLLILGYYQTDAGEKTKDARKNLAANLNLTMTTLKVKACRMRDRLEKCINECVGRLKNKRVTETPVFDTDTRREKKRDD